MPSGDTVGPDVSFFSRARLAAGPAPVVGKFLRFVPDLVVEILSPSTERRDVTEKKEICRRNGVGEYWIVDARAGAVTVFAREGGAFEAGRTFTSGRVESRVLPQLEATVEAVLAD
jgi:Uma2 family endonuclease